MKKLLAVAILASMVMTASPTMATLGSVRVTLNTYNNRMGNARANTIPWYVVYFRYNVDIKEHQWVKVWFPAKEASSKQNDICDQLPALNGILESQRFIPNEKYFEKYPNSQEKEIGKLYKIIDHMGNTNFLDTSGCINEACKSGDCGFVKDSSGLGHWMLGCVMPPLPRDKAKRMEELKRIIRGSAIGYNPCSDCQGYPTINNAPTERSFLVGAMGDYDAWRKGYNSIDYNFSKNCGIMLPATPGRYRIAIATEPEPEPVESESFILPCSDVSDVTFEEFPVRKQSTAFSVCFTTGEGGALDKKYSTIRLRLPRDFRMMTVPTKSILVNDVIVEQTKLTEADKGEQILEITSPVNVDNFGKVTVDFLSLGNFLSLLSKDHSQLNVATSSEGNFIAAKEIGIQAEARMTILPPEEYVNSDIYLSLPLKEGKTYPPKTEVKIIFDNGFELPEKIKPNCYQINGANVDAKVDRANLILILTSQTELARKCLVSISNKSGITNPPSGIYDFNVFVGNDELFCEPFDIFVSKPHISQLELSNPQAAVQTNVSFIYKPSSNNPIKPGDEIGVAFPAGSVLPEQVFAHEVLVDGTQAKSVKVEKQTIEFTVPKTIDYRKPAKIELKCFITNPREKDGYFIKVVAGGGNDAVSEELTLIPAPLVTKLTIARDDTDSCDGGWYGKPPMISFDCLNPDADIFFWFNGFQDKAVRFYDKFELLPGCQVFSITWQAVYDGKSEQPKTQNIFLDTDKPYIEVLKGKSSTSYTNQPVKLISGEAKPRMISYFDDKQSHVLVDSVFVKFNGVETKVFDGGLFKKSELKSIDLKFSHNLNLSAGENEVEVIARSLSCNETIKKIKIILDTTPPQIEMISFPQSYQCFPGDEVKVSFRTEPGLYAYCNDKVMPEESNDRKSSVFYTMYPVVQGKNRIILKVTDFAGNITSKEIVFTAIRTNTISLTLNKPSWDVNSEKQPDFAISPTATFKDDKLKALNGTTFVPVATLVPFLGCSVEFVQNGEFATIDQYKGNAVSNTIILALDTNTALVNGEQVKLGKSDSVCPVSIKGTMMVPLRFLAQYLGADLTFDSKTKQITLTYPK